MKNYIELKNNFILLENIRLIVKKEYEIDIIYDDKKSIVIVYKSSKINYNDEEEIEKDYKKLKEYLYHDYKKENEELRNKIKLLEKENEKLKNFESNLKNKKFILWR